MEDKIALIFGILFGLSEVLALIPFFKSNSVFQLVFNVLSSLKQKLFPPKV